MDSIGFNETSDYYENFSFFSEDERKVVKVLLENLTDSRVWRDIFPNLPNTEFIFATAVEEAENLQILPAEGCKQLDAVGHYHLGKHLIICKDSDYNYITYIMKVILGINTTNDYGSQYIFETKVHSIENIEYYQYYIYEHFSKRLNLHISSFQDTWLNNFYNEFSQLIYMPVLKLIFINNILHELKGTGTVEAKSLYKILLNIRNVPRKNISNFDNFFSTPEWNRIKQQVSTFENTLNTIIHQSNSEDDLQKVIDGLVERKIDKNNFYLFFKGHYIESIFIEIFKDYLFKRYKFNATKACSSLSDQVAADRMRQLMNSRKDFDISIESRDLKRMPIFLSTVNEIEALYST